MKEYRDIRAKVSFLELCKNTDLAAEVSLQPYKAFGVDAVIFFSDILIPVEAMGVGVELTDKGPEIANPIRNQSDVDRLHIPDPAAEVPFVGSIIAKLRRDLQNEVPLIGFAGAPWTLASYMIEGGGSKSFAEIKSLAYREPKILHSLMEKLAQTVSSYLRFQIESGAQAIQLFDTWAGELNAADYQEFALPYTQKIFDSIGTRVPRILYLNGCSAILESMARSGADVVSIDWRISIADARRRVGDRVALQGNLDPCVLLGPKDRIIGKTREILDQAGPLGHILNLGHGILPPTPIENARTFIDCAKSFRHTR
jgi:uroporphyrinogen decarboxylase